MDDCDFLTVGELREVERLVRETRFKVDALDVLRVCDILGVTRQHFDSWIKARVVVERDQYDLKLVLQQLYRKAV
jgi:hypothetical protein